MLRWQDLMGYILLITNFGEYVKQESFLDS